MFWASYNVKEFPQIMDAKKIKIQLKRARRVNDEGSGCSHDSNLSIKDASMKINKLLLHFQIHKYKVTNIFK